MNKEYEALKAAREMAAEESRTVIQRVARVWTREQQSNVVVKELIGI